MNTVQLIGRLTADPETRTTPNDRTVCRMRLAVPGRNRDHAPAFIDVEAWNKTAEACANHLGKGRRILVEGRLAHDQWQTDDGSRRQRHYVVANTVEFLDPRPTGSRTDAESEVEPELAGATA